MAVKKLSRSEIEKFWNWFSQNCQDFGKDFGNTDLIRELDEGVVNLGNFSWEIGPGKKKENALVISPNGDVDLLPATKEIIAEAPECDNWEYYYAKPPKEWDFIFDFTDVNGQEVRIDASEWEYVLLQYEDGLFSIIIKDSLLSQLDQIDQLTAAEILLDGVLGEETRIEKIADIEVVKEFENSYSTKAGNVKNLLNHLEQISPNKS
jgi:hypothetical protein